MATWVYQKTEQYLWTVGFYDPVGRWHTDGDFSSPQEAAERVHYLNGRPPAEELTNEQIRYLFAKLED